MNQNSRTDSIKDFKGALFDLDGVITNTAKLHAQAWQQMFDNFLAEYGAAHNQTFQPFSLAEDYPKYIDGKPRYEGVKSFLESRGIQLAWNATHDGNTKFTIESLGNQKNEIFQEILDEEPVEVYNGNIDKIREWRKAGIKTGIISSSKNCAAILVKTNLNSLFDIRVDGVIAEKHDLRGKPEPDFFIEGAKRLGLAPADCIVFEDAISGVHAGNEGDFGLVVGVTIINHEEMLLQNGADIAIADLDELSRHLPEPRHLPQKLANASKEGFLERTLANRKPALFLDYDGTLTPIVSRPENAVLADSTRQILGVLAQKVPVAIISGRDCKQVASMVGVGDIYYAGSHGFDIQGPNGFTMQVSKARSLLPVLDEVEQSLYDQTSHLTGIRIERKRFAIAVHFRNASQSDMDALKPIMDQVAQQHENLKLNGGKKIFELKPNVDWDKGKAVDWLLQELNLDGLKALPFYIGDDLTDEDAFRVMLGKGIGILVGDHGHRTFAQYYLEDVTKVEELLKNLNVKLAASHA